MGDSLCLVLVLVGSLTLEVDEAQNRGDSDFAPAKRGVEGANRHSWHNSDPLTAGADYAKGATPPSRTQDRNNVHILGIVNRILHLAKY
jgi:hypothetical protein